MTESVDTDDVRSSADEEEEEENIFVDAIIWVDANVNIEEENRKAQQELRQLFESIQILVFERSSDCEEYVQQHSENSFLIIVSRQCAQKLIENIYDLENIKSIYIYCRDQNWEEALTKNFTKISGTFNEMHKLVTKLELDQKRMNKAKESLSVVTFLVNSYGDSTLDSDGDFIHFRLLLEFLRKMDWTANDEDEFLAFWTNKCSDIISDRRILDEFMNTYSPDRVFWCDIYEQLNALQHVQPQTPIRTYRGQLISAEELTTFEKSVNQSVLMKSFLSTTVDRNLALFVLGDAAQQLERWRVHQRIPLKRVLFIIDADPSKINDLIPFADISSKSYFPEEQETLFMAGCIFRVCDVRFDEDEKIHMITGILRRRC
ncbi:unnamed protein product [Rotaria sp. Silwood1]|nr:unnamed protein product [Rotaria sp. Silwood1]CAF1671085.1 unnamed protein product [Rotaria sp. Silwood1]